MPSTVETALAVNIDGAPNDLESLRAAIDTLHKSMTLLNSDEIAKLQTIIFARQRPKSSLVPSIAKIKSAVCDAFHCSLQSLITPQTKGNALPRQVAAYLSTRLAQKTVRQIGRELGYPSHHLVARARDLIEEKRQTDQLLNSIIQQIEQALKEEKQ